MPLRIWRRNERVRTWRRIINARFGGLYTRLHGELPTDTDQFGPRAVLWQKEYEARTQQEPDGVVSDNDLRALGILIPPSRGPEVCGVLHQRCRLDVEHGVSVRHWRDTPQVEVLADPQTGKKNATRA